MVVLAPVIKTFLAARVQKRSTMRCAVSGLMCAKRAISSGRSAGAGTHHRQSAHLSCCHDPAEPSGNTRCPISSRGTPQPADSITPAPSKPGTNGNVVRDPCAPAIVRTSDGLTVLAIILTTTSSVPGGAGPETSRSVRTSPNDPGEHAPHSP